MYPSPPPSLADPSSPPRGTPPFPYGSQPATPEVGNTITENFSPASPILSIHAPLINGSPRSDAISELVLGSPISSLDLGESLDSIAGLPVFNGFFNGNENSADSDTSSHEDSSSSAELLPANSNDGLIAPSEVSLPSPACSSDLSEIRLPVYSPGPDSGHNHNNSNLSAAENFSENEEDAVSRARAIAFCPDHEEPGHLDSSLGQLPR